MWYRSQPSIVTISKPMTAIAAWGFDSHNGTEFWRCSDIVSLESKDDLKQEQTVGERCAAYKGGSFG
jgi:hypothetical protein